MYLSIGETATALGVSTSSLRNWENNGRLVAAYRTPGGHRRYSFAQIKALTGNSSNDKRVVYAYARVSTSNQKDDLVRQKDRLRSYLAEKKQDFLLLEDLGSGLNYKKPGLKRLLADICQGKVSQLVLTHKDRLLRFGSELIFGLCGHFGTKITVLDDTNEQSFEEELAGDVIQIMTVIVARLYGRRAQNNRRRQADVASMAA